MGMLDRYKKKGGFHQLLTLVETSSAKKKEQFLGLILQESPAWEKELKIKILTVERIFSWPHEVMVEVLTRIQPLTLCATLYGRPQGDIEKILVPLPPITKRKILDQLNEIQPNAGEKFSSEVRLITEVRGIAASGYIKFEKFDPDLCIEDNIEERLHSADVGFSLTALKAEKPEAPADRESKAKKDVKPAGADVKAASAAEDGQVLEFEALKKKMNQLMQENNSLKHENQILKDKLVQIRKIA